MNQDVLVKEMTDTALTWGSHGKEMTVNDALFRMGFRDRELEGKDLTNFKVESEQAKKILNTVRSFADGMLLRPGLFMVGPPGRGKTHLARGVASLHVRAGKGFRYKRIQDLIAEAKKRMERDSPETPEQHIKFFCDFPELLIIDEIGRTTSNDWILDNVVYPLVDERKSKPTIFISNFTLPALEKKYDAAVTSRLQICTTLSFAGSDMQDWRAK